MRPEIRELMLLVEAYGQAQADIELASIEGDMLEVTELRNTARNMYQDILAKLLMR